MFFETYNEAFIRFIKYLNEMIINRESKYENTKFDDIIENYEFIAYKFLTINKKFVNKDIHKEFIKYGLVLCYSDKMNKFWREQFCFSTKLEVVYIMSLSMFNNMKKIFNFKEINNKM